MQEGASAKVTAFSPLEASIAKPRSDPLRTESLKARANEVVTSTTYYMIPPILLVSRNVVRTSVIVMSVFHQIYMFHKEILRPQKTRRSFWTMSTMRLPESGP